MDISNDTFKAIFSFQHHSMWEDLAHVIILRKLLLVIGFKQMCSQFGKCSRGLKCLASQGLGLHVFVKVVTCICQISYTYLWFLTNGRVECSVWHLRGLGGLRVLGQSEEANPTCTFVALPPAAIFCQHHLNHLDSPESQGVRTCVVCFFVSELITIQAKSKWRKACIFLHQKNQHLYMNREPQSSVKHIFL